MSKKYMKVISIIVMALCIIMLFSTVFAELSVTDVANGEISSSANTKLTNIGNMIATIIRNVGIVLAVVIIMILGIKYMMGSASEKAEYKKTMIPYVVGAVILFGAAAIAQAVISLAGGITTT